MSLQEAAIALGEPLQAPPSQDSADIEFACPFYYIRPSTAPAGLSFMVIDDTIVRADVESGAVSTMGGLHVGSSETDVRRQYAGSIDEDRSLGGETLLILTSTDVERRFLVIFKTDGNRVTSYRAGRRMAAQGEECA
jgi:hypothetical protein